MNIKSVNKINDNQEVIDNFKQNTLNIIINNSASEPNAQNKQESDIININSPKKFIELPLIIKFTRIPT